MTATARRIVALLGPQRLAPTAAEALEDLIGKGGPVAVVTAGWEEREGEHAELGEHLDREVTNLSLFARSDDLVHQDPELGKLLVALRRHHEALQRIYRLRLRYRAAEAEALLTYKGPQDTVDPERESALEGLRALDAHHRQRVSELYRQFEIRHKVSRRSSVRRHRREIEKLLKRSEALCIAGGHVRVLLSRLRLFGVLDRTPEGLPIVAWSAGAMALTDSVVLFHDSPPQGKGWAEVLGPGLGTCPGLVALPHARRRLDLADRVRVQMLAQRFPEAICAVLDESAQLRFDGRRWVATRPTLQLITNGDTAAIGADLELA